MLQFHPFKEFMPWVVSGIQCLPKDPTGMAQRLQSTEAL